MNNDWSKMPYKNHLIKLLVHYQWVLKGVASIHIVRLNAHFYPCFDVSYLFEYISIKTKFLYSTRCSDWEENCQHQKVLNFYDLLQYWERFLMGQHFWPYRKVRKFFPDWVRIKIMHRRPINNSLCQFLFN